jgi:hypothetical protein
MPAGRSGRVGWSWALAGTPLVTVRLLCARLDRRSACRRICEHTVYSCLHTAVGRALFVAALGVKKALFLGTGHGEAGVVRTYCAAGWFVYGCDGEVAEAGAQAAPPGAGCVGLCGDARATRLVPQTDTGTY